MRKLDASDVLLLWERGLTRHAIDRSSLLVAWARPELAAERIADLPLGEVTANLLQLRAASFGARIRAHVDCERCGQRLELNLVAHELLQPGSAPSLETAVAGLRLRPPCLRDLAAIAHERDAERAARALLARCMLSAPADVAALPDATLREIEDALEAADPNADLAFDVRCEACDHLGTAQLDAGELLWDEIDARARALLGEVHLLASAYGWSEGAVLGLSAARRAAYLSMVAA
jgi:hypothetical protein